jgi:hypothetical protein
MLPRLELPPILSYLLPARTKLSKVISLHFFETVTNSSVILSNLPICKISYINLFLLINLIKNKNL